MVGDVHLPWAGQLTVRIRSRTHWAAHVRGRSLRDVGGPSSILSERWASLCGSATGAMCTRLVRLLKEYMSSMV